MAGFRSPGIGRVLVESPPHAVMMTTRTRILTAVRPSDRPTVRPSDSRNRPTAAEPAIPSGAPIRAAVARPRAALHRARLGHAAPDRPALQLRNRARARENRRDRAFVPRRP